MSYTYIIYIYLYCVYDESNTNNKHNTHSNIGLRGCSDHTPSAYTKTELPYSTLSANSMKQVFPF